MSATGNVTADSPRMGVFPWIANLFTLDRSKFHPLLGAVATAIAVVSLVTLKALGYEELALSFIFGLAYTALTYVGAGAQASRVRWSVAVVLVGALLTVLAFALGGGSWVLVTLAVFVSTLLSYFAGAYGARGARAGVLLNIWFLIALHVPLRLEMSPAQALPLAGPQGLAWLVGGALWLALAEVVRWVARTRQPSSSPATPAPEAAAPVHLSRPLVAFSVLAALGVALAVAVAWSLDLPEADWMPVATIVALKPSAEASAYVSGQRLAGAIIGAIIAAILLSTVHDQTFLEIAMVLFLAVGLASHEVNYALYVACISTAVLTALGLATPGNLTANGERVAWTLVGVVIALAIVFLAARLASHEEQPRAATA